MSCILWNIEVFSDNFTDTGRDTCTRNYGIQ